LVSEQGNIKHKHFKKANMDSVQYSIEFAHIYADENFDDDHRDGAEALRKCIESLSERQHTYSVNVLIDDYNPALHILDRDHFVKELSALDARPHFLAYESQLPAHSDKLMDTITRPKLKREYQKYIDQRGKYPCSFLVAVWYLIRLGAISLSGSSNLYARLGTSSVNFTATKLINILPSRFAHVERQALELIAATPHAHLVNSIESRFFESNLEKHLANLV
jgi:hypothetical protein